jgi:hypothetical protein
MKDLHNTPKGSQIIKTIKEWAAPTLFALVSMLIWRDISELRTDVKTLLAQANGDKVRIEKVESDVSFLKTYIFNSTKKVISQSSPVDGTDVNTSTFSFYALKDNETYEELINKIKNDAI